MGIQSPPASRICGQMVYRGYAITAAFHISRSPLMEIRCAGAMGSLVSSGVDWIPGLVPRLQNSIQLLIAQAVNASGSCLNRGLTPGSCAAAARIKSTIQRFV